MPARFSFDRFLQIRSASSPAWSPDGETVAFMADITGVPQLWSVAVQGGWPDQLTFASDRVMGGHFGRHTPWIVFGMDQGGNEREQLLLLRDGQVSDVAVDPAVMHVYGAISPDDRRLAYSSNRRDPAFFDVYVRDLSGGEERCVYQQDGSNFVADWSEDGERLLVSRRTGPRDVELVAVDLASGRATNLTPPQRGDGPVLYQQARFAPDGRRVYLATDRDSQFLRAAVMDMDTCEIHFLTLDECDVDWLSPSPDGRSLAMVRNLDGYGRLSVRDLETGQEEPAPELPPGVAMQPEWSPDGSRLAFTFAGPADNPNIWVWDVAGGGCRQLTHVTRGGIPRDTFVQPDLVHFTSFDGRQIPAFLYLPAEERPPVIVSVHGGPEAQAQPIFNAVTQYFVNRGYAVLAPNVRGSAGYGREYTHLDDVEKRMDSVADLEAAARWLAGNSRVAGDRLAVMGGSYGGFMVLAALTTYPDLWAAGVDIVGIANLETFLRNTSAYRRHWRIPEYGDPDRDADLFRRISPIHHVERITAPLMVIHGDNDPRVPVSEAEQIVAALRDRGRPVEFQQFPDEGHGIIKLANKLVAYPAIAAFLDRYLKGE